MQGGARRVGEVTWGRGTVRILNNGRYNGPTDGLKSSFAELEPMKCRTVVGLSGMRVASMVLATLLLAAGCTASTQAECSSDDDCADE